MNKIITAPALFFLIFAAHAQSGTPSVIRITGTRFPYAIMQKWIDEYSKTHPQKFELGKSIPADSADLVIAAHAFRPGELKDEQAIIALNRYAQLPIVNSNRPGLKALEQKGFMQQDLVNIFFTDNKNKTDEFNNAVTIYKRDKNVCASRSFAENITGIQKDIYGIGVTGDDRSLSVAVKNDLTGISYNNLGFIYDLKTRKVNDSLAVIPIDLNENGTIDNDEKNYTTLDRALDFIQAKNPAKIPAENVNVIYNKNNINKNIIDFLSWIITEGQQYNHAYGFLDLDSSVSAKEQVFLQTILKENHIVSTE